MSGDNTCILIVSSSVKFYASAQKLITEKTGCETELAATATDAKRMLLTSVYPLVIINTPLSDGFGTELAAYAVTELPVNVLLFTSAELFERVKEKTEKLGIVTLARSSPAAAVELTVSTLITSSRKLRAYSTENDKLKDEVETVRLTGRAKLLLMQRYGMTEAQAHKYIEHRAMDAGLTKKTIAENIIKSYE